MSKRQHWEQVYQTKAPDAVSWYAPHLYQSLSFIERIADKSDRIIDVGGGESTLVDDLLERGYEHLSVLDISQAAIDGTRQRLGAKASHVHARPVLTSAAKPYVHVLSACQWHAVRVCLVLRVLTAGASVAGPRGSRRCPGQHSRHAHIASAPTTLPRVSGAAHPGNAQPAPTALPRVSGAA